MFTDERHQEIIKYLQVKNRITVAELCKRFYVSQATVRRDLAHLEAGGLLRRCFGGAVIIDSGSSEPPFAFREQVKHDEKSRIASLAASMLTNGQTVFFDTSSTVCSMIKYLDRLVNLTAVTNCIEAAALLSRYNGFSVYCAGGLIRDNSHSIIGTYARDFISGFNADFAFLSCRGFDAGQGVTEALEAEAHMKRIMIDKAARTVLLCDSSKIGKVNTFKVCDSSFIHALITEAPLSREDERILSDKGVEVYIAGKSAADTVNH